MDVIRKNAAIIILTIAAIITRFYGIASNSLWLDEAATYSFASRGFIGIWDLTATGEFNPPLFHWIEHFMLLFGNNEFVLRFVPAVAGVLLVPIVYIIGKEIHGERCGIIAAFTTLICPTLIFYSQEARAYMLVVLFISIALYFTILAQKTNQLKYWILMGAFSALAFWTHFYAFIPIIVFFLFGLLTEVHIGAKDIVSRIWGTFIGFITFIVLSLPLVVITIPLFITRTSRPVTYGVQGFDIVTSFFSSLTMSGSIFDWFIILIFFAAFLHIFVKGEKRLFYLFSMLFGVSFLVSIGLSYSMPMLPRYILYLTVPLSLIIAYGIADTSKRNLLFAFLAVGGIFLASVFPLWGYYTTPSKDNWRDLSPVLSSATRGGENIVVIPDYNRLPLDYYYNNSTDNTNEYGVRSLDELTKIKSPSIYIVTGDVNAVDVSGGILQWLNSNAKFVGSRGGIGVYVRE